MLSSVDSVKIPREKIPSTSSARKPHFYLVKVDSRPQPECFRCCHCEFRFRLITFTHTTNTNTITIRRRTENSIKLMLLCRKYISRCFFFFFFMWPLPIEGKVYGTASKLTMVNSLRPIARFSKFHCTTTAAERKKTIKYNTISNAIR